MVGTIRRPIERPAKKSRITPEVVQLFIEAEQLGRHVCGRVGCERCTATIDAHMAVNRALGVPVYTFGPSEDKRHPLRRALLAAAREQAESAGKHDGG